MIILMNANLELQIQENISIGAQITYESEEGVLNASIENQ